ncbi:MAG: hypothetical protein EA385_00110 [Salinarimonadaceae bacterium]|nr:MAG: hypothetical protein EA385_00110 [Salinarimonadaceae bacterium]
MKTLRASLFTAITPGQVPEWIHLMPAGEFRTSDKRGPFRLGDAMAVIAASLAAGGMLAIDQDHATDLAAKRGEAAPARGWIVELDARADGVWGRVEWTETGRALLSDRAYRGISPVFTHSAGGDVRQILRAALTNDPALPQLTTLMHRDDDMDWKKELAALLGMKADASDEDVMAAVKRTAKAAADEKATAARIAKAAGLDEALDADGLVTALASRQAQSTDVDKLRGTVSDLTIEIASLKAVGSKAEAERVVDAEIVAGKPIKAQRDVWVQLMASDPDKAKAALAALPSIKGDALVREQDKGSGGLTAEERKVCALVGVSEEKFLASRQSAVTVEI